jgi:hypothetical protein
MVAQIQNDSVIDVSPYLYKYGLTITNDATTPNTKLDIAAGQCRDSANQIDMGIGSSFVVPYQSIAVTAPIVLDATINGANGLDTGSLGASSMYAVYLIGDSRGYKSTATILSLASSSAPLLPLGYDSYRIIGYWATDASSHFLLGYYTGNQGLLIFKYDAPQATAITAGAATSYTAVTLTSLVPPVNNSLVNIQFNLNANAAGDTLKLQGANATGDAITIIAQAAGGTAHLEGYVDVDAQLVSGAPKINYKVSTASAAVALNVAGFIVAV